MAPLGPIFLDILAPLPEIITTANPTHTPAQLRYLWVRIAELDVAHHKALSKLLHTRAITDMTPDNTTYTQRQARLQTRYNAINTLRESVIEAGLRLDNGFRHGLWYEHFSEESQEEAGAKRVLHARDIFRELLKWHADITERMRFRDVVEQRLGGRRGDGVLSRDVAGRAVDREQDKLMDEFLDSCTSLTRVARDSSTEGEGEGEGASEGAGAGTGTGEWCTRCPLTGIIVDVDIETLEDMVADLQSKSDALCDEFDKTGSMILG